MFKYNTLNIRQIAEMLGINIQTLRRWDKSGKLKAEHRPAGGPRFYYEDVLTDFLMENSKYCQKLAEHWSVAKTPGQLPEAFYCPNRSTFQTRLSHLELMLKESPLFNQIYSLITAIAGEIGNNSFDHNLGNWPDVMGIFFGYSISQKMIILADRGQGILTTLKRLRPELNNHADALKVAFTEIISGRAPESRGNGLKFVRQIVQENNFSLFFQTGDAMLFLNKSSTFLRGIKPRRKVLDKKSVTLPIKTGEHFLPGCFAKLNF